jgi:serine/threonine-protein kinase
MRIVPIICLVVLLIAAFVSIQAIAGGLPERVATHFAADGQPNGYMSREACRIFMLEFTLGMPLFLAVLTGLFPFFVPVSLFNLPNREYWLAPAREADSRAFLSEQGIWFACLLLVFLIAVDWMVAAANSDPLKRFPTPTFTTVAVIGLTALGFWLVRFVRRFGKPPKQEK